MAEEKVAVTEENAEEVARKEYEAEHPESKGKEAPKETLPKDEDLPKSDEEILSAKDEDLNEEELAHKKELEGIKAEEDEEKENQRILNADESTLNDDEKKKRGELVGAKTKKEEDELLAKSDEELDDDAKTKKAGIVKAREEAKTKAFDEEVKTYAEESGISEEEAREDLDSIGKIQEKYKDDPKQLAKAYLSIQRLHTKTAEEVKTLKEAPPPPPQKELTVQIVIEEFIDKGKITVKGQPCTRESIVEAYKANNPGMTATADDETILKMAAKEIKEGFEIGQYKKRQEDDTELGKKAKVKQADLIKKLSAEDKKFYQIPKVKAILDRHTPRQIMHDSYSVNDVIQWAKGEKYNELVKSHAEELKRVEAEAFKRGQENRKVKSGPSGADDGKPRSKKGYGDLSTADQAKAREMFPNAKDNEECYKLYIETEVHRKELKAKKDKAKKKGE